MIVRSYHWVERLPLRIQLGIIGLGYAAVLAIAAGLLFVRYLAALRDPVSASGGMWAAGDVFLGVFLAGLFLTPTVLLVWVIARFEAIYLTYARILLGFSLSGPVCLGALVLVGINLDQTIGYLCLDRLLGAPFVLAGIGFSRLVARFDPAKRLTIYALLVEGLTIATAAAVVIKG